MIRQHYIYTVDLRRPYLDPRYQVVNIKTGKKCTWAHTPYRKHLVGSSAFYTKAAAQRTRYSLLKKITAMGWIKNNRPYLWNKAQKALTEYVH